MRRVFSVFVAGAAVASACAGPAAPSAAKTYRIVWLSSNNEAGSATTIDLFRQGLKAVGLVEGKSLVFDIRYADGNFEKLPALASELIALKPDVMLGRDPREVLALKQATSKIPIVMAVAGTDDPVKDGLVASLTHPGGNVTGVVTGPTINARQLQLLTEALPAARRVAYLYDASSEQGVRIYQTVQGTAPGLKIEILPFEVRATADFPGALAAIGRSHPDALVIGGLALINSQRQNILDFIATNHYPSMAGSNRSWADGGALLYFNSDLADSEKRAATYVDRILKGASPSDLPVEFPTKYELIINMRTARALGVTIPPSVLAQATELIQ